LLSRLNQEWNESVRHKYDLKGVNGLAFQRAPKGPLPFSYVLLLSFVLFLISTIVGLWILNASIKPTLMKFAQMKTEKIANLIIDLPKTMDINEIIETVPAGTSGVVTTKFNTELINRAMGETSDLVMNNLNNIEQGNLQKLEGMTDIDFDQDASRIEKGIVYHIPLGQATNNSLLSNLGPNIPIRFHAVGDVNADVHFIMKEYGINNVYVQVMISIEATVQIIVPFATKVTTLIQEYPLAAGLIQGKVPNFYNKGSSVSPSITLPSR
jgi:sporulation protein YunB